MNFLGIVEPFILHLMLDFKCHFLHCEQCFDIFSSQDLFKGFPQACDLLATLRTGALASGSATRWDDEWREHVLPLLTKVAGGREQ
jgi:protein-disulfide isomerase-like protein with CxxC motif